MRETLRFIGFVVAGGGLLLAIGLSMTNAPIDPFRVAAISAMGGLGLALAANVLRRSNSEGAAATLRYAMIWAAIIGLAALVFWWRAQNAPRAPAPIPFEPRENLRTV